MLEDEALGGKEVGVVVDLARFGGADVVEFEKGGLEEAAVNDVLEWGEFGVGVEVVNEVGGGGGE